MGGKQTKQPRVLMLGLDHAGKSTILYRLKFVCYRHISPIIIPLLVHNNNNKTTNRVKQHRI
jgi:ABC-type phosphate/phosphonate transport system ATPase subunit